MVNLFQWSSALAAAGLLMSPAGAVPSASGGDADVAAASVRSLEEATAADPFLRLERDIRADVELRAWVAAQNGRSRAYLDAIAERPAIAARLDALSDIAILSAPRVAGGRHFYRRRDAGEEQASLHVRDGEAGEVRRLLDPIAWAADGSAALAGFAVDRQGRHVAVARQEAGSDWRSWHVIDVESGQRLADDVRWNKFADIVWDAAGEGFYYTRFPSPGDADVFLAGNRGLQLYHHRLGDPQSADRLVYEDRDNPDHLFAPALSPDGRYLFISYGYTGGGPRLLMRDLLSDGPFVPLFAGDASPLTTIRFVGSDGPRLFFLTNIDAPNRRLVMVDADDPEAAPVSLIPERRFPLQDVAHAGGRFFAQYLEDAKSRVLVFDEGGRPTGEVDLPEPGLARGFNGDDDSGAVYFEYSTFARPFAVHRYDIAAGRTVPVEHPEGPVDPSAYHVEQRAFTARDGKRITMFVARRADLADGKPAPVLLYGYGGFGLSFPPDFRPEQVTWMDMGGIFAFPALPGGGEYGRAWHEAGRLENKPAVFDAFIDAADYLIGQGLADPARIAAFGYSNGGLLVGAAVARRPDLFAVSLPTVGVLDMLRFPMFTNGRLWATEYGDPADPAMFPILAGYSPYHTIRPGLRYPATLVGTADTDDRVYPAHSFKYAARLQADADPANPVLLNVESNSGHGAGTRRSQVVASAADRLAFTLHMMGMTLPPDFPNHARPGGRVTSSPRAD